MSSLWDWILTWNVHAEFWYLHKSCIGVNGRFGHQSQVRIQTCLTNSLTFLLQYWLTHTLHNNDGTYHPALDDKCISPPHHQRGVFHMEKEVTSAQTAILPRHHWLRTCHPNGTLAIHWLCCAETKALQCLAKVFIPIDVFPIVLHYNL